MLRKWGTANLYRRMINNKILETLRDKNGIRQPGSKYHYKQLFNFNYSDGAKMLTTGGIIYDEGQERMVAKCSFESLLFVRTNDVPCLIEVPKLTFRELRLLDAQLPLDGERTLSAHKIPEDDLRKYSEVYRYFPTFAEAEL